MEHQPVQSSNIASVGYDPATQTLEVRFASGGLYRYAGVDPATHKALLGAESVGRHLHAHIKPRFACSRVGGAR